MMPANTMIAAARMLTRAMTSRTAVMVVDMVMVSELLLVGLV